MVEWSYILNLTNPFHKVNILNMFIRYGHIHGTKSKFEFHC